LTHLQLDTIVGDRVVGTLTVPAATSRPATCSPGSDQVRRSGMCRNIRPLFNFEPPATDDDMRAAALQYVRKVTGYNKPSRANEAAFDAAVESIAGATRDLLDALVTAAPPRDRAIEVERARTRARQRYGQSPEAGAAAASGDR
jgi:hypothetical protein